jgi:hypothetical protein
MAQASDSPRPQPPTPAAAEAAAANAPAAAGEKQRDQAPTSEKQQNGVNNNIGRGPAPEAAFNSRIDPKLESLTTGPRPSFPTPTANGSSSSSSVSASSAVSTAVPSVASEQSPPAANAAVVGGRENLQDNGFIKNGHSGQGGENGSVDGHSRREGSDATLSPAAPPMTTPQGPHGHQRQQHMGHYTTAGPAGYPGGVTMPGAAQYAYAAAASGQMQDPYRAGPAAMNSAMSLPSMRSIDPMQHAQAHAMHMGAQMGSPMGHAGAAMPYYGQPFMHDPNAMRFPLQPLVVDPRGQMTGGRHKKVGNLGRRGQWQLAMLSE